MATIPARIPQHPYAPGKAPAPDVRTAHDVRRLRCCAVCRQLGDRLSMIQRSHGEDVMHFHGRCFISLHGMVKFLRLPMAETDKCSVGDIGTDAMKALLQLPRPRS